jgi:hypothetical protein
VSQLLPNLINLKGYVGAPTLTTRQLLLTLRAFESHRMEAIHPLACLTLLPMAEEIDVRCVDFEAGEGWPLSCRPYLKRLLLMSSPGLTLGQLKQLLSAIPNIQDLKLILDGGVDGFDEEVLTLKYRIG